jgi:hypothetical protein
LQVEVPHAYWSALYAFAIALGGEVHGQCDGLVQRLVRSRVVRLLRQNEYEEHLQTPHHRCILSLYSWQGVWFFLPMLLDSGVHGSGQQPHLFQLELEE